MSHKSYNVVHVKICLQILLNFVLDFFSDLLSFNSISFSLHIFGSFELFLLVVDFQSHSVVVMKDA